MLSIKLSRSAYYFKSLRHIIEILDSTSFQLQSVFKNLRFYDYCLQCGNNFIWLFASFGLWDGNTSHVNGMGTDLMGMGWEWGHSWWGWCGDGNRPMGLGWMEFFLSPCHSLVWCTHTWCNPPFIQLHLCIDTYVHTYEVRKVKLCIYTDTVK